MVKFTLKGAQPELILVVKPAVTWALQCSVNKKRIAKNGSTKKPEALIFILFGFPNKFIPICPKIVKKP